MGLVVSVDVEAAVECFAEPVGVHTREPDARLSLDEEKVERGTFLDKDAVCLGYFVYFAENVAVFSILSVKI